MNEIERVLISCSGLSYMIIVHSTLLPVVIAQGYMYTQLLVCVHVHAGIKEQCIICYQYPIVSILSVQPWLPTHHSAKNHESTKYTQRTTLDT